MPKTLHPKPPTAEEIEAIREECRAGINAEEAVRPAVYHRILELVESIPGWEYNPNLKRARSAAAAGFGSASTDPGWFKEILSLLNQIKSDVHVLSEPENKGGSGLARKR